ncbi:hypothetical protein ACVWZ6_001957 [Bradyrhizobium sp. GM6.1]
MRNGQHLAADEARDRRPAYQRDRGDDRIDRGLQDRDQDDRERKARNGLEELGETHQGVVDPAAEIAGHGADRNADDQRNQGGDHADEQRDACAEDHAGEHVAAECIGAERHGRERERRQERPLHHAPGRVREQHRTEQGD